ncbi:hypothetical protein MesoLj131c_71180 (plasmid) [Mesorhizobium sp. 131-3-5]|nr:hypothetical protein MesoLj131c_71180 [Mesorhizobium sp. 131-3-5]
MFGAYTDRMAVVALVVKAGLEASAGTDTAESRWRRGFEDNQRFEPFHEYEGAVAKTCNRPR